MSEPKITVTIKFRGVSLEGLTPKELRELRDAIDQVLGERVIERRECVPYRQQPTITWGASGTKIDVQPAETVITCGYTKGPSGGLTHTIPEMGEPLIKFNTK